MKKVFLLVLLLTGTLLVYSQDPMFVKGDRIANIGIGLGSYGCGFISLEQCISDGLIDKGSFGVGVHGSAGYRFLGGAARFVGGVRGTFHYPFIDKLDTYVGIGIGLRFSYWFNFSNTVGPAVDGFLGARYPLSDKLKVFAEVGSSGLSWAVGGLSFDF